MKTPEVVNGFGSFFIWSKSWFKKLRSFIETESILEVEIKIEAKYSNSLPFSILRY